MASAHVIYPPGARVLIRDAEWVIRKADLTSDGGHQLTCDGISELVRDKTGIFLTNLEDKIDILNPAKTELVDDNSGRYSDSILYIESLLRRSVPNDEFIHIGHKAAMDVVPYQLVPTIKALKQPRQRILIADAVGLGKTLEAGILVTELMRRGQGKRILVLALKSMLTQFQKEFWNRFTIPLTRLDSAGLQRVRRWIPTNHNPFYYYDKSIISIDTLKQDSEYRTYLERAHWDIIIIDEAHNVAQRGTSSMRAKLAKLLSTQSDTLIMLTATPHDGKAKSFASLINMLDPTAISDPENYGKEDFQSKGLVLRRFKKDIQDQVGKAFKERKVYCHYQAASIEEEIAYASLLEIPFTRDGIYDAEKPQALIRVTFQKALFSSPAACTESVNNRLNQLKKYGESEDVQKEVDGLVDLNKKLEKIDSSNYTKYQKLIARLRDKKFDWKLKNKNDRIVIFSERIETLHFLEKSLKEDIKAKDNQIQILHGGMSDTEQNDIVEKFGKPEEKIRILLCSDVASEGINLHYLSHRLIHFDMPWSLMIFQQRNGRIDRYGQENTPQIHYLVTESVNETISGDIRVLEILRKKDEQAYENIGDPSIFMNVYDVREEEKITEEAVAAGIKAEDFDAQLQPTEDEAEDLLTLFTGTKKEQEEKSKEDPKELIQETINLFKDDYTYTVAALNVLNAEKEQVSFSTLKENSTVTLIAPDDLKYRFGYLPKEIIPENWEFSLTDNIDAITREVVRCRQDENAWPKIHYLWPQHPILEWLNDRMLANFGRHTAPIIHLQDRLEKNETIFIISGLVPNRKSHPLIYEWLGVRFINDEFYEIEPFNKTIERTKLGEKSIPNTNLATDKTELKNLIEIAITKATDYVIKIRNRFEDKINVKLEEQLNELDKLRKSQFAQLELILEQSTRSEGVKKSKKAQRTHEIDRVFDEYLKWIEDTMTTEKKPYIQLVAVLTRQS